MTLLGEAGLHALGRAQPRHARSQLAERLGEGAGRRSCSTTRFFNEFTRQLCRSRRRPVVEALAERGHPRRRAARRGSIPTRGRAGRTLLLVAATETTTEDDIDALAAALEEVLDEHDQSSGTRDRADAAGDAGTDRHRQPRPACWKSR